jgi:hypothetical protein
MELADNIFIIFLCFQWYHEKQVQKIKELLCFVEYAGKWKTIGGGGRKTE